MESSSDLAMDVESVRNRGGSGIDTSSGVDTSRTSSRNLRDGANADDAAATSSTTTNNNEVTDPPPAPKPKFKPKPPKNKRKLSRKKWGSNDRKRSSFGYAAAKEAFGIDPSANDQQIISAILFEEASTKPTPPPPSPDKNEVKRENKKLKADNQSLKNGVVKKDKKIAAQDKKIAAQDLTIRGLLQQLRLEKKASNTIMNDTMSKAMKVMEEAVQLREMAKVYENEVEDKLMAELQQHKEQLREERQFHSRETARTLSNVGYKLCKQDAEHKSAIKLTLDKHGKQKVSQYVVVYLCAHYISDPRCLHAVHVLTNFNAGEVEVAARQCVDQVGRAEGQVAQ